MEPETACNSRNEYYWDTISIKVLTCSGFSNVTFMVLWQCIRMLCIAHVQVPSCSSASAANIPDPKGEPMKCLHEMLWTLVKVLKQRPCLVLGTLGGGTRDDIAQMDKDLILSCKVSGEDLQPVDECNRINCFFLRSPSHLGHGRVHSKAPLVLVALYQKKGAFKVLWRRCPFIPMGRDILGALYAALYTRPKDPACIHNK